MKLLEILLENETSALGAINSANFTRLNQASGTPVQIEYLKRKLATHTLVNSYDNNGTPQTGGPAWSGPIDPEWNTALSNAITQWKRSVNRQLENAGLSVRLDTAGPGQIAGDDIRYLEPNPPIQLSPEGLLLRLNDRNVRAARNRPTAIPIFAQQTYIRQLGQDSPAGIRTIRDMVNAIGWSGWFRLSWEVATLFGHDDPTNDLSGEDRNTSNARLRFAERFINNVYSRMDESSSNRWIDDSWNAGCLGGQQRVVRGVNLRLDPRFDTPVSIYEKFAPLLRELWQEDIQRIADGGEERAAADAGEPVVEEDVLIQISRNLHEAMHGGTGIGTDEQSIGTELNRLRSRGDWENLVNLYNRMFSRVLHEDLYEELNEDPNEYAAYVTSTLMRLRVINHILLHSLLQFGTQNEIVVEISPDTYRVQKERENNKVIIGGYDDFDDIVIDRILRAALEQQGIEPPANMRVDVTLEHTETASGAFITAIEDSYPEMVAWYTYQEPFNQPSPSGQPYPDFGSLRMRGIIEEASQLVAVNTTNVALLEYIKNELSKDREWLIGTGEDNPGIANIRFDSRYGSEGNAGERYFPEASDDDLVELTDDEREILDDLISVHDDRISEAIGIILDDSNKEDLYIRLYRDAAPEDFLDKILGEDDTVRDYVLNRTRDNSHLMRLIAVLGVPTASPRTMAELFRESTEFSFSEGPTNDELLTNLIDLISNRSDYNLVDERYRRLSGVNNSLLEDMGNEEWIQSWGDTYYNRLASKIGSSEIALVSAEVSSRFRDALQTISEDLSSETIEGLERAIELEGSIPVRKIQPIIQSLNDIVEIHQTDTTSTPDFIRLVEIRNAFLHYKRELMPPGWRPGAPLGGDIQNGARILDRLASREPPSGVDAPGRIISGENNTAAAADVVAGDEETDFGPMP